MTGANGGREEVHPVSSMNPFFHPSTERDFIHKNGQPMVNFIHKAFHFLPSVQHQMMKLHKMDENDCYPNMDMC
jgi:hypothetical protein